MNAQNFPNIHELKSKSIFREISLEAGHPEVISDNLEGKIREMGYGISDYGSFTTDDKVAEGVKDFKKNISAIRLLSFKRKNQNIYKNLCFLLFGAFGLFILLALVIDKFWPVLISVFTLILGIIFFKLTKPIKKYDVIWISIVGKVYSGTKSKEIRDSGSQESGIKKVAHSVYIYSEIKFLIAADSEADIEKVRIDVGEISKYLQKI